MRFAALLTKYRNGDISLTHKTTIKKEFQRKGDRWKAKIKNSLYTSAKLSYRWQSLWQKDRYLRRQSTLISCEVPLR